MSFNKNKRKQKQKNNLKDKMQNIMQVDDGKLFNFPKDDINSDLNLDEELFVSEDTKSPLKSEELFKTDTPDKLETVKLNRISDSDKIQSKEKATNLFSKDVVKEMEANANVRDVFGLDQENITGKELELLEEDIFEKKDKNSSKYKVFFDEPNDKFVEKGIKKVSKEKVVTEEEEKSVIAKVILEVSTFILILLTFYLLKHDIARNEIAFTFIAGAIILLEFAYHKKSFLLLYKAIEIMVFGFAYIYLSYSFNLAIKFSEYIISNFNIILGIIAVYGIFKSIFVYLYYNYKATTNKTDINEIL